MVTKVIQVIKGDYGYDINFTLNDADEAPIDLTNATLLFKAQKNDGTPNTLKVNAAMSIVVGTAGTCKYTVAITDFDEPGRYNAEIQVTYPTGSPVKVITLGEIVIDAKPDLPRPI